MYIFTTLEFPTHYSDFQDNEHAGSVKDNEPETFPHKSLSTDIG